MAYRILVTVVTQHRDANIQASGTKKSGRHATITRKMMVSPPSVKPPR